MSGEKKRENQRYPHSHAVGLVLYIPCTAGSSELRSNNQGIPKLGHVCLGTFGSNQKDHRSVKKRGGVGGRQSWNLQQGQS
jgi:hypothetical protein